MKPTKVWAIVEKDCELRWDTRPGFKAVVYSAVFKVKRDSLEFKHSGQHVVRVEIREVKRKR